MACCGNTGSNAITNVNSYNLQIALYQQEIRALFVDAALNVYNAYLNVPVNFDTDPGDDGDEIDQRSRALCLAVESIIDELMNQGVAWVEALIPDIVFLGVGALAIPSIPMWVSGAAFAATALALGELREQLADPGYRAYVACGMFEALQGEASNDRAAFSASLDSLPVRPPPPETATEDIARDAIETWLRSQINDLDNYLVFVENLDRAFNVAASLEDNDCLCIADWEFCFDFTVDDGGWIEDPGRADFGAFYTPGVGWQQNMVQPGTSFGIALAMTKDATFLEWCMVSTGSTVVNKVAVVEPMGTDDVDCLSTDHVADSCVFVDFTCPLDFATQAIKVLSVASVTGLRTVSSVCFRGSGANPFI